MLAAGEKKDSAIDLDRGPPLDSTQTKNYRTIQQILIRYLRQCDIASILIKIPLNFLEGNQSINLTLTLRLNNDVFIKMYLRQRQKVGPCRLGLVVGIVSA
jgi:hypothetical protein